MQGDGNLTSKFPSIIMLSVLFHFWDDFLNYISDGFVFII